ncbi:MAG: restriction endonuclease subunit S, partial [Clostridia bacterium]|nr:restriction endonuclease subunit S [Clostridia bacterium]
MIVKLGSLISEYSVRNKADEDIPVYSVTNEQGFCTGYFSKDVSSQDRTTYKIVPRGYFAYNPSRINVGSVDVQECEDRVIVSPLYVVFSVDEKLNRRYLLHYLKSDITLTYIKAYASGSVRDNLKFSILKDFPINLPSAEEQKQIVATLDGIEHLIALRTEEIASLDELVKSRFIEL